MNAGSGHIRTDFVDDLSRQLRAGYIRREEQSHAEHALRLHFACCEDRAIDAVAAG